MRFGDKYRQEILGTPEDVIRRKYLKKLSEKLAEMLCCIIPVGYKNQFEALHR